MKTRYTVTLEFESEVDASACFTSLQKVVGRLNQTQLDRALVGAMAEYADTISRGSIVEINNTYAK